jgi:hypothetical protein
LVDAFERGYNGPDLGADLRRVYVRRLLQGAQQAQRYGELEDGANQHGE